MNSEIFQVPQIVGSPQQSLSGLGLSCISLTYIAVVQHPAWIMYVLLYAIDPCMYLLLRTS